jgi:hypothetical protein
MFARRGAQQKLIVVTRKFEKRNWADADRQHLWSIDHQELLRFWNPQNAEVPKTNRKKSLSGQDANMTRDLGNQPHQTTKSKAEWNNHQ